MLARIRGSGRARRWLRRGGWRFAQPSLPGLTLEPKGGNWYEHAVLVTNWAVVEEPMGLDGVFDAGPEAESVDGAHGGADLQLVEDLHAHGHGREAWRGDHDPTSVSAAGGTQDQGCKPDVVEYLIAACQGQERGKLTGQD